uniref:Uncharacterized protein n=1 Tax=Chromera velia CCMP2878 TaxID=1169474 RepID=A0A0G4FH88_9ALVE|eukprot:Cvel_16983.t1-p1 / transcript=Cvel_16983.t1 / gene=Cvel_16983 / organism=Chromera_velia_CCMP2878 / gene_product=Putative ankyrin repeat protein MM_0045, putative / transcript_product=Putative ankyrin repeat protein MM_0045, putative / location=Cvel_scaffold1334:1211-2632(+) / protein_length=474 / sequence_SO=supercontig / SO=protein_coding / is_pseudo=false
MPKDTQTLSCVRHELGALKDTLLRAVGMIENMERVLGNSNGGDGEAFSVSAAASSSQSARQPPEAAGIVRLRQKAEGANKTLRVELNKVMSLFCRIDLSYFFTNVPEIAVRISEFQSVAARTVRDAVNAFVSSGDEEKREDLALLLRLGADVDGKVDVGGDKGPETALVGAVRAGRMEVVEMLVDAGAGLEIPHEYRATALMIACDPEPQSHPEIARFLVSKGAVVNVEDQARMRPLHYAACDGGEGGAELVDFLFSRGASVHARDMDGDTALHAAIKEGNRRNAEILLDRGANVNDRNHQLRTPLFCTVLPYGTAVCDHKDIAELLISRGADVNARQWVANRPVLHDAALSGSADVIELLLDNGADVHATIETGRTALHFAAQWSLQVGESIDPQKKLRTAQLLVSRGIDPNAVDQQGLTALQLASILFSDVAGLAPLREYLAGLPGARGGVEVQGTGGRGGRGRRGGRGGAW